MTTEQLRRVMAPKVLGALHLHELTAGMPLDYFILYSSGTTLFGNPGQGNYVAANSWLEALASHRQAAGMPVTCIALGAIDDAGYLARNAAIKEALQFLMGGSALTSGTALAALERMLCHNSSGLGIQELDWNSLRRFMPRAGTPKFSELARLAGNSKELREDRTDLFTMAAELPDEELLQAVIGMLKEVVGEVLRIAPEKIDEERQLYNMGLDSLMGVELAVAIESRFGIKLPAMILSENPTIRKLATYFIQQLRSTMAGSQPGEESGTAAQVRQVVNQFEIEGDLGKIVQSIQALRSDADPAATTP
jgi:acyl carrier protein